MCRWVTGNPLRFFKTAQPLALRNRFRHLAEGDQPPVSGQKLDTGYRVWVMSSTGVGSKTQNLLNLPDRLTVGAQSLRHSALVASGKRLSTLLEKHRNSQAGPLSPDTVEKYRRFQDQKVTEKYVENYIDDYGVVGPSVFLSQIENLSMQQQGARLLFDTLSSLRQPKLSVANIGARLDTASAALALLFPNYSFVSVDFQENLAELNRLALGKRENWTFKTGYALDLIRANEVSADVFFATSTTVLFNNVELDSYLNEITKRSRIVVLNEPWAPQTFFPGPLVRPERIPNGRPFLGGTFNFYHHNYVAKFVERNWKVAVNRIVANRKARSATLQIVATKD